MVLLKVATAVVLKAVLNSNNRANAAGYKARRRQNKEEHENFNKRVENRIEQNEEKLIKAQAALTRTIEKNKKNEAELRQYKLNREQVISPESLIFIERQKWAIANDQNAYAVAQAKTLVRKHEQEINKCTFQIEHLSTKLSEGATKIASIKESIKYLKSGISADKGKLSSFN